MLTYTHVHLRKLFISLHLIAIFVIYHSSCSMTKPTTWPVDPAKTQISLVSLWSTTWRRFGPLATHKAHSKDSDQNGCMPRLIWVFTGHIDNFVGLVVLHLINSFDILNLLKNNILLSQQQIHKWDGAWQNQQNDLCTQRRLRSAWESTQSDQSSLCALIMGS